MPFTGDVELKKGDEAYLLVSEEEGEKAMTWLYSRGWYSPDDDEAA